MILRFVYLLVVFSTIQCSNGPHKVSYLEPGDRVVVPGGKSSLGFLKTSTNIFCYRGKPKIVTDYFHTVFLNLDITNPDDYVQYEGCSPEEVLEDISNHKSIFSFNFLWSSKRENVKINPFNNTCIGIETGHEYHISLSLLRLDLIKVTYLVVGSILFLLSKKLSENALFFYITGICLGVFASVLVLIYFISKLLPQKPMMYGALLGGWTLVFYFGNMLWQNLQMIFMSYKDYAIYYCLFSGFISFIVCYRYGPPKDKRSLNLIKWSLQFVALFLIFQSSDFKEASFSLALTLLLIYYFPYSILIKGKNYYRKKFPGKRKLISKAEYERQAKVETAKALDELKSFCNSPECRQWSTVMKLKNPARFASFMEGSSHLLDSEIMDHETSDLNLSTDDDSDENKSEISEDEEEVMVEETPKRRHNGISYSRTSRRTTPLSQKRSSMPKSHYNGFEVSDDD